ncbi:MAG: hypothetical protein ABIK09_19690 [Pseudomonadota bacterium]
MALEVGEREGIEILDEGPEAASGDDTVSRGPDILDTDRVVAGEHGFGHVDERPLAFTDHQVVRVLDALLGRHGHVGPAPDHGNAELLLDHGGQLHRSREQCSDPQGDADEPDAALPHLGDQAIGLIDIEDMLNMMKIVTEVVLIDLDPRRTQCCGEVSDSIASDDVQ